jgi:hypothetical protein
MTIQRTRGDSDRSGIAVLINNTTSAHSHLDANINRKIVNIGGGFGAPEEYLGPAINQSYLGGVGGWHGRSAMGFSYGDWTLIPTRNFTAEVKLWGAGGGSHGHADNQYGGGGGFARAEITFLKEIPYTFWVGQGGFYSQGRYSTDYNKYNYRTAGTFGNGGGGGHNSGSGGGLSGIFFNTLGNDGGSGAGHGSLNTQSYGGGVATWFRSPSQNNALLIAGGGGGAGHSNSGHHGQGGGGGGTSGNPGHNSPGGTQTAGGTHWINASQDGYAMHGGHGGNGSHAGGGGGGWYGGAGGSHHSSHYNGGGGGSGHSLELNSVSGYRNYWIKQIYSDIVRLSYLEVSPSSHSNAVNMAAGRDQSDWGYAGIGAGGANRSENTNTKKFLGGSNNYRDGMNGRVVIKVVE